MDNSPFIRRKGYCKHILCGCPRLSNISNSFKEFRTISKNFVWITDIILCHNFYATEQSTASRTVENTPLRLFISHIFYHDKYFTIEAGDFYDKAHNITHLDSNSKFKIAKFSSKKSQFKLLRRI